MAFTVFEFSSSEDDFDYKTYNKQQAVKRQAASGAKGKRRLSKKEVRRGTKRDGPIVNEPPTENLTENLTSNPTSAPIATEASASAEASTTPPISPSTSPPISPSPPSLPPSLAPSLDSLSLAHLFSPPPSVSTRGSFLRSKFGNVLKARDAQLDKTTQMAEQTAIRRLAASGQGTVKPPTIPGNDSTNAVAFMDVMKSIMLRTEHHALYTSTCATVTQLYAAYLATKRSHLILTRQQTLLKTMPSPPPIELSRLTASLAAATLTLADQATQIKTYHTNLAVALAHLRATTVAAIQSVQRWRRTIPRDSWAKGNAEKELLPPVFVWEGANYLLTIQNDLVPDPAIEPPPQPPSIILAWLGFTPLAFFLPPPHLDVAAAIRTRRDTCETGIRLRRETANKVRSRDLRIRMSTVGRKVSAVGAFSMGEKRREQRKTEGGGRKKNTMEEALRNVRDNAAKDATNQALRWEQKGQVPMGRRSSSAALPTAGRMRSKTEGSMGRNLMELFGADASPTREVATTPEAQSSTPNGGKRISFGLDLVRLGADVLDSIDKNESDNRSEKETSAPKPRTERMSSAGKSRGSKASAAPLVVLDSDDEELLGLPDLIPEEQLVRELPAEIRLKCERMQEVLEEEAKSERIREALRKEQAEFRMTNVHPLNRYFDEVKGRPVTADDMLARRSMSMRPSPQLLIERCTTPVLTGARSRTANSDGGSAFSKDEEVGFTIDDFKSFFVTEQLDGGPSKTSGGRASKSMILMPKRSPSKALRPSTLSAVHSQNPSKFKQSPFPAPLQGHVLVNCNSLGKRSKAFYRYNPRQAAVLLQGFGRLALARKRMRNLRECRFNYLAAELLQRAWRGKKGRTDFMSKLRGRKTGEIRARIELREIERAAKSLTRFFDNIRYTKMEKFKKNAAERLRLQEKTMMRMAIHDASAFQIQRVWFNYLHKKEEFNEDFDVKYAAARAIQAGIRTRLARKQVKSRRSKMLSEGRKRVARAAVLPPAYLAVVKLQCWGRVIVANNRIDFKRERRNKQLQMKIAIQSGEAVNPHLYGGMLNELDDESSNASFASSSMASITFLMGSSAAIDAATFAAQMTVDYEKEVDVGGVVLDAESVAKIPKLLQRGAKSRRSIISFAM